MAIEDRCPRSGGRVRRGRRVVDAVGVLAIDLRANLSWRLSFIQHVLHVTRDSEADASSRGHRVEYNSAIGIDSLDVAVAVAAVSGALTAAAVARNESHELPVSDLELVQPLDLGVGVSDEARPIDVCQIPIRLVGRLESAEPSFQIFRRRIGGSYFVGTGGRA